MARILAAFAVLFITLPAVAENVSAETTLLLNDGPRNSEGDFIELADGTLLFAYTRFSENGSDFGAAEIVSRESADGGLTWTESDRPLVANEGGLNVMSVSFLRLADGRIALLYLRKISHSDCRPYLRISADEGKTWNAPISCIDRVGYYVVNNDRMVQLPSGRLLIPVAIHSQDGADFQPRGTAACLLSDDGGATWRWSATTLEAVADSKTGLQEPGLVPMSGETVWMYIRTDQGAQLQSMSEDGGNTWSDLSPTPLVSPVAPATVEKVPGTDRLVAVWNDHDGMAADDPRISKRTPLTVAVSDDNGTTWERLGNLEDDPAGWYAYTAITWTAEHMVLAYGAAENLESGRSPIYIEIVRIPLAQVAPSEQ